MAYLTAAQAAADLLDPTHYWGSSTITFGFPQAGGQWAGYAADSEPTNAHFGNVGSTTGPNIVLAAGAWDRLIALTLQPTTASAAPNSDITIAFTDLSSHGANAATFTVFAPTNGSAGTAPAGDIWLDYKLANTNFASGSINYLRALNAFGHALGLNSTTDGASVVPPEYDTLRYSIMSRNIEADQTFTQIVTGADGSLQATHATVIPVAPMVFDIAAIQARYGADTTTNAGDSSYTIDQNAPSLSTIYDAAGNDTIDLSTHTRGSTIDLTPGAYSSIDQYSVADQKAAALALHPEAATLINSAFDASTYTWSNNLGIAFGTIIENVKGGSGADSIVGNDVANNISGGAGNDTVTAGFGDDTLTGGDGQDVLRGEDGNDSVDGGADFDDLNGNKGADTVHGGTGDDWVSGGQDDDIVYGDEGHDLVYGNIGNDTVYGNDGDDWIRGGQGNDIVDGGTGNDLIWGDRGDDTLTGGSGADQFHTFAGAGVDRVTDFNGAEGDRVVIDDRTAFTVAASGSDTVITLSTGDTVVLQGVAFANFHADWVVSA